MATRPETSLDRLMRRIVVSENGCWLWQGATDRDGYGRFGHRQLAHRAMYELAVGPIPEGYQVDHLCFVRACVRPEHLDAVTPLENRRRQRSALRTECAKGHPYNEANTYFRPDTNRRVCRRCNAAAVLRYKARQRSAQAGSPVALRAAA